MTIDQAETETNASIGSRRNMLKLLGVGSVGLTLPLLIPSIAEAATTVYTPQPWSETLAATEQQRLFANRFTYGYTPELLKEMKTFASPEAWFIKQITTPSYFVEPAIATEINSWYPKLFKTPKEKVDLHFSGELPAWIQMDEYSRWVLMKRLYSRQQPFEEMVEFWENHFHIPLSDDNVWPYRADYAQTIRKYALTSFEQLLKTLITHPAMSVSLDNATNNKTSINENLGRELLELHTVGFGNYTQTDVVNSSRILTGYRVKIWDDWTFAYDPTWHYTGAVKVKDFSSKNASSDGRQVTADYLKYLAYHPNTAQRICRKLAVRFVSDNPSQTLINNMVKVYLDNSTKIIPLLTYLIKTDEFKKSSLQKVKTPTDEAVATYKALKVRPTKPTTTYPAEMLLNWSAAGLGHTPFSWPSPAGVPDFAEVWSSPARLLASFQNHFNISGQWWPPANSNVIYPTYASWVPTKNLTFAQLVDHLTRTILGQSSNAQILEAACLTMNVTPTTVINATDSQHMLRTWGLPALLTAILDSPYFLRR